MNGLPARSIATMAHVGPTTPLRRSALLALVAAATLLLGACSNDPENEAQNDPESAGVAAGDGEAGAAGETETEPPTLQVPGLEDGPAGDNDGTDGGPPSADVAAAEQAAIDYSTCLRDQGLDVPDFGVDGNGNVLTPGLDELDLTDPTVQAALAACQGPAAAALGDRVEDLMADDAVTRALADFSSCLRDAGLAAGDVTTETIIGAAFELGLTPGEEPADGGPSATDQVLAGAAGLDLADPAVAAAVDGCDQLLAPVATELGFAIG